MDSIFNVSEEEILEMIEKVLNVFKQIMAWLGILVLPENSGDDAADPDAEAGA
ncbi:MAG: hypothetical protein IJS90_05130 [Clostridia bacterium]|nr:hypothetical protein [Clostridia bacterium]